MHDRKEELEIRLHSYAESGECLADITLPETGILVQNLTVKPGLGGGVQVHMPPWMHSKWGYPEISWSEVRTQIAECYRKGSDTSETFRQAFARFDQSADRQVPETLRTPLFRFYSSIGQTEYLADVTDAQAGLTIPNIFLACDEDLSVRVYMPQSMRGVWPYPQLDWNVLQAQVAEQFRAQVLLEDLTLTGSLTVRFHTSHQTTRCLADIALPGKRSVMKGFRLKILEDGSIQVSSPKWMTTPWRDKDLTWYQLADLLRGAYQAQSKPNTRKPEAEPIPPEPRTPAEPQTPRLTNEFGRIQNADSSPFRFVPQTVLRLESAETGFENRRNTDALVYALTQGPKGGIGPMEIKLVSWVEQLRYLTSTMLTDLFQGGYISRGWREKITRDKLNKIIARLEQYGLIDLTRFVAVDENGVIQGTKRSASRILTLGKQGSSMLHDIGISTSRYRPFDIFQDGNTVKRYLAANQWMIYWMIHFPAEIGDDYEAARIVYQRGSDMQGARFYATVICNGCPMVAEPVRRVEEFEVKANRGWLRDKLLRLLEMFGHIDELYSGREELVFPQRPVLVYICEDDAHIQEVWASISDIANDNPDQEIWFTTDPRIFNYNMVGQRFLKVTEEGLTPVQLADWIGTEEKPPLDTTE